MNKILKKKKCRNCCIEKSISEFKTSNRSKDGHAVNCRNCAEKYAKQERDRYNQNEEYRDEKLKSQLNRYHTDEDYKKKVNKDRSKRYLEQYKKDSEFRKKVNKNRSEKLLNKYHDDPKHKVHVNISSQIRQSIKKQKNGQSWEKLVGYSLKELIVHLESQFEDGMTWDNYGEWHIDHKVPKSWFKYTSYEEANFKKCWSLENLKPMWASDNILKGNRYSD